MPVDSQSKSFLYQRIILVHILLNFLSSNAIKTFRPDWVVDDASREWFTICDKYQKTIPDMGLRSRLTQSTRNNRVDRIKGPSASSIEHIYAGGHASHPHLQHAQNGRRSTSPSFPNSYIVGLSTPVSP